MTMTTTTEKRPSMMKLFDAARRAGVPLLAVRTADQSATIAAVRKTFDEFPIAAWDAARGIVGVNKAGTATLKAAGIKSDETYGFLEALVAAQALPDGTIFFVRNAERQIHAQEGRDIAPSIAAIGVLRDLFKLNFRTLVLLGPTFTAPAELEHDVVTLDHELPGRDELAEVVLDLFDAVRLPKPTPADLTRIVDAVTGLSVFEAEQILAMSFTDVGMDVDALWERKRATIEAKPGLSVVRGATTFADLRGLDSVKARLGAHKQAKTPIGVVVWIDEGADVFSAVDTGTNDQKMDQQRGLLVEMEQNGWRGCIFVGVPGSGKSAIAAAFGNEAGVPAISVDFGAMENKFVGESEARFRSAIDVIKRVGDGHAFFVLTCNSLKGIRPQFMRRFKRGVFFFDLPSKAEREAIWMLYLRKFGFVKDGEKKVAPQLPDDEGWTGAEIRECCESAWDTGVSLVAAAKFIIPVSRSRATEIEEMRREANGRFLDANHAGAYEYAAEPMAKQVRAIALPSAK